MNGEFEVEDEQITIAAVGVRSLVWHEDTLVDWVSGGTTYQLNGEHTPSRISWGYRFDNAVASPSGRFVVIYERLGKTALLLDNGKESRELISGCTGFSEYPIALFASADGREVIAHCPTRHDKIEIEDLESGQYLGARDMLGDFYHSRLAVNADGTKLIIAGWYWGSFDTVVVYDLRHALPTPDIFEGDHSFDSSHRGCEINSAVFNAANSLVLSSATDAENLRDDEPKEQRMTPGSIGVFDLNRNEYSSLAPISENVGTMMPLGDEYVIGFYEHPKLIHAPTGRVLRRWENIHSGLQNSSIIHHIGAIPPMAFDWANRRFAVADADSITVVTLL